MPTNPKVKSTNKKPKKLPQSKAARAVAIAQDVLLQLRKLKPTPGIYAESECFMVKEDLSPEELQTLLQKRTIPACQVCALGAAMLAHVRLYDSVPADKLLTFYPAPTRRHYLAERNKDNNKCEAQINFDGELPYRVLEQHFTHDQMEMIEAAFEADPSRYTAPATLLPSEGFLSAAQDFGWQYRDSKKRLKAIMENIIENKGKFCPEKGLKSDKTTKTKKPKEAK